MYRLAEAQKHPLVPWVVQVTPEGYARCWVWQARGVGWDGSTAALRGIVDTGVRALQSKYRERAEAVMERYRESRDRAAAVEQCRNALFKVAEDTRNDALRDAWPQIEERIMEDHPLNPTIDDADSVLRQFSSMKNYLTTALTRDDNDEDDEYEVRTSVNMGLVHTHTDAHNADRLSALISMAADMLVGGSSRALSHDGRLGWKTSHGLRLLGDPSTELSPEASETEWIVPRAWVELGGCAALVSVAKRAVSYDVIENMTTLLGRHSWGGDAARAGFSTPAASDDIAARAWAVHASLVAGSHADTGSVPPAPEPKDDALRELRILHAFHDLAWRDKSLQKLQALPGLDAKQEQLESASSDNELRAKLDAATAAVDSESGTFNHPGSAAGGWELQAWRLHAPPATPGPWTPPNSGRAAAFFELLPLAQQEGDVDGIVEFGLGWGGGEGPADAADAFDAVQQYLRSAVGDAGRLCGYFDTGASP